MAIQRWAYAITTVPERFDTLLGQSLKSLSNAGFQDPHVFVDAARQPCKRLDDMDQSLVHWRSGKLRTYGHWLLSLLELYVLNPLATRFAIFQDDILCVSDLREFLDACTYPKQGYWSLYTFPENETKELGWHPSNQRGKGALGLVFSNDCLRFLLTRQHMIDRIQDTDNGWRMVDHAVIYSLRDFGWREFVHSPSLMWHCGEVSSMNNPEHPPSVSFPGEHISAMTFLPFQQKYCRAVVDIKRAYLTQDAARRSGMSLVAIADESPTYRPRQKSIRKCMMLEVREDSAETSADAVLLQKAMNSAGYSLCGADGQIGLGDIREIIEMHLPDVVIIPERENIVGDLPGSFAFDHLEIFRDRPEIFRVAVISPYPGCYRTLKPWFEMIQPHAYLISMHPDLAGTMCSFARRSHMIRYWPMVVPYCLPDFYPERSSVALLKPNGYIAGNYPIFDEIRERYTDSLDIGILEYPTAEAMNRTRIALIDMGLYHTEPWWPVLATAMGCKVVSDVPTDDVYPDIDENITRIHPDAPIEDIVQLCMALERSYDPERQYELAGLARSQYDMISQGWDLSLRIERMRKEYP